MQGIAVERNVPMAKPWFGSEEVGAVAQVIRSGWVGQGRQVNDFEREFAERVAAVDAVAVSSCTTALHLGLVLAGVGPGDEVVVPSLSFVATANAVRYVGSKPVFAEVDPSTHNVSAETVAEVLSPRTRAVIVVDQYGVPADLNAIRALCEPREIAVVEDAACAVGSTYRNRPVGADSDFSAFSFHPRKLVVTGEGGMITTSRPGWANRLRGLRQHAMSASPFERHLSNQTVIESYDETGYNYRMTDMQAALGRVQLRKLEAMVSTRRRHAARYHELLNTIPGLEYVTDPPWGQSNYQTFWVLLPDDFPVSRNELLRRLLEKGVHARHGVTACHEEPAFQDVASVPLPVTERISRQSLLIPMFHELTEDDQSIVSEVIHAVIDHPRVAHTPTRPTC